MHLTGALPDHLADYITTRLSTETTDDYEETRLALLNYQGYNMAYYMRCLFDSHTFTPDAVQMARQAKSALQYVTAGVRSSEVIIDRVVKYLVLNSLQPACRERVLAEGAANAAQFMERVQRQVDTYAELFRPKLVEKIRSSGAEQPRYRPP